MLLRDYTNECFLLLTLMIVVLMHLFKHKKYSNLPGPNLNFLRRAYMFIQYNFFINSTRICRLLALKIWENGRSLHAWKLYNTHIRQKFDQRSTQWASFKKFRQQNGSQRRSTQNWHV